MLCWQEQQTTSEKKLECLDLKTRVSKLQDNYICLQTSKEKQGVDLAALNQKLEQVRKIRQAHAVHCASMDGDLLDPLTEEAC